MTAPIGSDLAQRALELARSARHAAGPDGILARAGGAAPAAGGGQFAEALKRALAEVSTAEVTAREYMDAFVRGEPVELQKVVAAAREAEVALELLIEIRNTLTEAYRTVINMQA